MKILIKYIFATVFQKPVRLSLILLTLCLCGAAVLASVSISDTMIKTASGKWRSEYGYSDIVVTTRLSSPSRYFDQYRIEKFSRYFEYSVKKVTAGAVIGKDSFTVHGYTLDTLLKMLRIQNLTDRNSSPFVGNKIIISEKYAHKSNVYAGDTLTADINGKKLQFIVYAVYPAEGPFTYEEQAYSAIIPYEKMQAVCGQLGKADSIYVGLKSGVSKSHMILRLSELYKDYQVSETYSIDHIRLQSNRSSVPFVFMSVLLCLMAVYVIYVIFQNIVIERMPQMGIFRAMGAGRQSTVLVVLMEGLVYGIIGGVCSLGAGCLLLFLLMRHTFSTGAPGKVFLSVSPPQIALTLLISAGISITGGILSLKKYNKYSIIGLVNQNAGGQMKSSYKLTAAAFLLALASMAILLSFQSLNGLVLYVVLVAVIMAAFLICSSLIYINFALLVKKLFDPAKGMLKIVSLSIQSQRGFVIAATVLSVILATGIIIDTIAYSSSQGSKIYFGRFHYDIEITAGDLTRGRLNTLAQLPGISEVCPNYYSANTEVKGQNISIYRIHGIDTGKVRQFIDFNISSSYDNPVEQLETGKNILLTNTIGRIYNVKENDRIILKIFAYNGAYKEVEYKIIGFFDDEYTKLGRYALISQANFAEDFQIRKYSSVILAAGDTDTAISSIKSTYRDRQAQLVTVREMQESTVRENGLIISSMKWISYISVVTGIFGMLFIMLLSYKNRMGELAVYEALGFTKGSIGKMLFTEMLLAGSAGIAAGVVIGCIISYVALPKLIFSMQIAMSIYFSAGTILISSLKGLVICLLSGAAGVLSYYRTILMRGLRSE